MIKGNKEFGELSKKTWNKLAEKDAKFFILTEASKKGGKWHNGEFFDAGKEQWARFKKLLAGYELEKIVSKDKIALDLGCGVGRISFAMAQDFRKVIGIDVADMMIEKAREYSKSLKIRNVEFLVNNGFDLSPISDNSVDFVFSYLTLQHCPSSKQVLNYIKEFSRVLKFGGVALFQTRVAPTFRRYIRFYFSKKAARIKLFLNKDYHLQNAFMGNWVYYPKIYKTISKQFPASYLIQTPIEIYKNRFWDLSSEHERWKRSFFICIK